MGAKQVREALANPVEPSPTIGGGEGEAGGSGAPPRALPDGCPVVPVGTEGGLFYFLTALGELRALKPDQVANKHIVAMFAPDSQYLFEQWPRRKEVAMTDDAGKVLTDAEGNKLMEWITVGWRNDDVSMLLMDVCAQKGVWNAREQVRGRGGWLGDDGSLIVHAGSHVLIDGHWRRPNMYHGMVYPTAPAAPMPALEHKRAVDLAPGLVVQLRQRGAEIPEDASAGHIVLELFKLWKWRRPSIDPVLLTGWNVAAIMGAANGYRPLAWITGDKATGKSKLQEAIGHLQGAQGLLQTSDASEAAVRQLLGQQSLPVAIDEAEAEENNSKIKALVKLARLAASSQGNIVRGGQDHVAHEFRATSCFLFSSILVPPIPPQDKSRLSVLELDPLPQGAREPKLDKREMEALAAQMRLEVIERWAHWPRLLESYRDAMIDFGRHGGRIADQFGTLLAAAHLILGDGMPDEEELLMWGEALSLDTLAEAADNRDEATECAHHLITSQVQLQGYAPKQVSEWLADALSREKPAYDPMFGAEGDPVEERRKKAEAALGRIGLKVHVGTGDKAEAGKPAPGERYVAIATSHQGLARIFDGSRWNGGVWSQALARKAGAVRNWPVRILGVPGKAVLVPAAALVELEEADTVSAEQGQAT